MHISITQEQLAQTLNSYLGGQQGIAAAKFVAEKHGVATEKVVERACFKVTARGVRRGPDDKFPASGAGGFLWSKEESETNMLTKTQVERVREQAAAGNLILVSVVEEKAPEAPEERPAASKDRK